MTTPDPSRAAFEQWYIEDAQSLNIGLRDWTREELMRAYLERRQSGLYRSESVNSGWKVWQAAMAHKGAELEQSHEARRQAQTELADIQELRKRIGLDIDRALRGEVNERSPIAGRLKLIAAAAAPKQEGST
ncbi:hypothetical protein [Comamonas sp.]|uniref:hypothetical protein n=1 Tax=Comamonas sp. TaxID=34028 RepID=UPI00289F51D6|nr:hypothetical protein [Comamonas sp.]